MSLSGTRIQLFSHAGSGGFRVRGPAHSKRPDRGPSVRWSRVLTAQARISAGYYQRADVQDLVVGAVLNALRRR